MTYIEFVTTICEINEPGFLAHDDRTVTIEIIEPNSFLALLFTSTLQYV